MTPTQGDGKDPPGTPFSMALFRTSGGLADLDELSQLRDNNLTVCQNQQTNDPSSPRILDMSALSSEPKSTPFSPVVLGTKDQ